ncbi:uncharacterized protein LOC131948200 [Physella acuta]|uniref:uncharacterized protein LOC131948200 n=1 Tax=Physella acuta TaxID=109671 RepID=UPI0027DD49E6|nr:uncharacterized protein LOC131948200 [Physella acuta]
MDCRLSAKVIVFVLAAFVITPCVPQTPATIPKCVEDFTNALAECAKASGISTGNFAYFVTNGTSSKSEAPANQETFKTQICGVEQQIYACVMQKLVPIVNTTSCIGTSASTSHVETIRREVTNIFTTYDVKCMHPCRNTLLNDMRQCYTANDVDGKLFMSNTTNGAVIGSTEEQANKFCSVKDKLMDCLKSKAEACPESAAILRTVDIDLPAFTNGVKILCANTKVYVTGLSCFAETTSDVDICKQKQQQALIQLAMQAQNGNWTQDRYYTMYCELSYTNIACDVAAWARKNHESCTASVIGLRRELECDLLPQQCKSNTKLVEGEDSPCSSSKRSAAFTRNTSQRVWASTAIMSAVLVALLIV